MPITPCTKVCKQSAQGYCLGCKRHLSEITGWRSYSTNMREAIMNDLKERQLDE